MADFGYMLSFYPSILPKFSQNTPILDIYQKNLKKNFDCGTEKIPLTCQKAGQRSVLMKNL